MLTNQNAETDKPLKIYQCEDTTDGILSAIYEAGISKYGHRFIKIEPQIEGCSYNIQLFSEYVSVETNKEHAAKVVETVRHKISARAYQFMMYAIAASAEDRGDALYQFLVYGFRIGDKICDMLQFAPARRVFELQRAVGNEAHFSYEFLRFKQIQNTPRIMLAVFEPTHHVLPMVVEHFHERFMDERFIILDKTHREAVFHAENDHIEFHLLTVEESEMLEKWHEKEEAYVTLWKTFFDAIAIKERKNEKLQKNLFPLHYRKHVTEFID